MVFEDFEQFRRELFQTVAVCSVVFTLIQTVPVCSAVFKLIQTVSLCSFVFTLIQVGFQMTNLQVVEKEKFTDKFGEGLRSGTKDPSTGE